VGAVADHDDAAFCAGPAGEAGDFEEAVGKGG
jgi:hypothetical protein